MTTATYESLTRLGFNLPAPVPFPDTESWEQHCEALTAALIDDVLNGGYTAPTRHFDDHDGEDYES